MRMKMIPPQYCSSHYIHHLFFINCTMILFANDYIVILFFCCQGYLALFNIDLTSLSSIHQSTHEVKFMDNLYQLKSMNNKYLSQLFIFNLSLSTYQS